MDVTEKSNGAPSRLRAVLYGLLSVALWAAVLFLSVRAVISVSKDLEAVRNADSYADRSFTVSYDDLVYTQLGFGAEGASDEALAREEVVSYFDACVPLICERVFATVTFYLLMLGPFIGAAVFHATRGGEGPFAPRFGIILAAMLAMHVCILVAAFIVSGVPVAFTGPAPIVFIVVSYASAIAGSMVLGSLLARIRFALPAVVVTPTILFFVFSFDILFCAELLGSLVEHARLPVPALAYELAVPYTGSGIAVTAQVLVEEGSAVPVLFAAPYAVKALLWSALARELDPRR